MHQKLRAYFSTFVQPTDEEWAAMAQCFYVKQLPKNDFILKAGAVCKEMNFINKGGYRSYYLKDGKEITTNFFFSNSFVADYSSFVTQQPSFEYIEAVEDSELVTFSYKDMQYYYEKYPMMQKFGRLIAEKIITNISNRQQDFLLYTPKERYLNLIKRRPKVVLNLPQIHVATYLGITPEYLSRIRRELKDINS